MSNKEYRKLRSLAQEFEAEAPATPSLYYRRVSNSQEAREVEYERERGVFLVLNGEGTHHEPETQREEKEQELWPIMAPYLREILQQM